ncbi:MAG: group II intron reverse transcriptase/maturase [Planctomycetota bacterium]|nr:group II intron reverse transcriptase/maturase [Planctomycetota bacterium]MDI6788541.1 group II intron reverse transcriptase/maturase [Planctomycetota bacterium]
MSHLKYHSLRDKIYSLSNLYKAFYKVKRNKGACGVDKVTISMFENNLSANLLAIQTELRIKKYKSGDVRRVYIPKDGNKFRPLGIPRIRDRVIQQAFLQILGPIFERIFHDNSYGYRPNRSAHMAISKLWTFKEKGYYQVVDMDIKGFFDNINHKLMMDLVRQEVSDGWVLDSIYGMLKAGISEGGRVTTPTKGTPQGSVASPLLANIVLNKLDWWLDQNAVQFVRYADDFVCFSNNRQSAIKLMELIPKFLKEELALEISEEKSTVTSFCKGFTFLGYKFKANAIGIKEKSLSKFKDNIRSLTVRCHNSSNRNLTELINDKINPVIRGFANYFKLAECSTLFWMKLDCWMRMRLRAMKYKKLSRLNNYRMRNKRFVKMGLLSLYEVFKAHNINLKYHNVSSPSY